MSPHVYPIRTRHVSVYKAYTSRWWSDANGGRGINGRPRKQERGSRKERTKKGRGPGKGRRLGGRSLIQVGNPATPSNETDRLSYLHRLASINSRGWYTNTKESPRARVYIHHVGRARGETRLLPAGNRPTNHPYICVLKGIPEYILHMLYCRLISNSIGREERPRSGETAEKEREGRRGRESARARFLASQRTDSRLRAARPFFSAFSCILAESLARFALNGRIEKNVTRDFYIPILELICLFDRHGGNRDDDEWTKIKFPSSFHFLRIILNKIIGKVLIG